MERQEASVAPEHLKVTGRSPLIGIGHRAVAAGTVPALATRPHKEIDYR